MPDYLRYRVLGGTYFFTITLLERGGDLLVRHIDVLREAVRRTRAERPFHIDAWVVMPDHIHCVLTLPPGDADFSNRIKAIKISVSRGKPRIERRPEGVPSRERSQARAGYGISVRVALFNNSTKPRGECHI
jgi:putative transposase